jgi:antiviral helicase SKI2
VLTIAKRIDEVQKQFHVKNSSIVDELRFGLMDVVYRWACGEEFSTLTSITSCQEGIIVRCIQRTEEVLKNIRRAAKIIGDDSLCKKMEEVSETIKRDIVFADSLYIDDE